MKQTLLLVIDLQKGWRHKTATEGAMLKTVELCKKFPGDIIHCCFKNTPESLFHKQLHWKRFVDSNDTSQIPEIAAFNLKKYWRDTYSCVNNETLPVFKRYGRVFIAGVFTDVSVTATAMDLFDNRIPVSVVSDCVGTLHGQPAHKYALRSLEFTIGIRHLVESESIGRLIKN